MPTQDTPVINPPPKLLDQVRDKLRVKHYSMRPNSAYVNGINFLSAFPASMQPGMLSGYYEASKLPRKNSALVRRRPPGFCSSVRRNALMLVATKMPLVFCLSNDLRSISVAPLKVLDVLDVCLAR